MNTISFNFPIKVWIILANIKHCYLLYLIFNKTACTKYVNKTVAVSCHERQESNVCLSMLVQARFPSQVETTSFNQALSRIVYRAHMFRAHNGNGLSRFSSLQLYLFLTHVNHFVLNNDPSRKQNYI